MNKRTKRILNVLISTLLIISVSAGVILTTQLLYKVNHKTADEIIAEKNEVVLGEESIFYVDLTKNPDDYEKISKVEENVNKEEQVNESALNQMNEEYFNIEFDLDWGIATVDGNEMKITDLLEITEEEESDLLSSEEKLYNYLNENVIGDIEYKDGTIQIENPYSTNTIMMKTSNLTEIENCGEVQSIVKVADDIYCVHYENAKDTKEGYNILKENNLVENVCKDAKITTLDDVSLNSESLEIDSLAITGDNYAWGVETTGLRRYVNKLNYGNNNTEIKVAVLDTGVRTTHEVFANETTSDRIDTTYSYNYISDNKDIADDNGHGTMVAGIIAESTSNNVEIVPVKVMGSNGKGDYSSTMEGLAAIANNVDVINLSLGVKESEITSDARTLGEEVLKQIYDNGKIVVCASGNDGEENVYYPASSQYTIAVSALNTENSIATFSNYGSTIDFAAPGQGLILPYYTGDNLYNASFSETSEEYRKNSGTSFAAPFVAAAASLIKAENTNYTIEQVREVLKENGEDLGDAGKDKYYGYGSLDFDSNMFSKPVIASINVSNEWAKENTIEIYAVCGNSIKDWAYTTSEGTPGDSDWKTFTDLSTIVKVSLTTEKNGNYYIWFKDEKENTTNQLITVQYVDNTEPIITSQIEVTDNTSTGFKAKVSVQDNESGLSKINWYYKKSTDTDYQIVTDTYTTEGTGEKNNTEKTHQFSNLESDTIYSVYAEIYDIAGNFSTTTIITTNTLDSSSGDVGNTNTNTSNTNTDNTNTNNTNTSNTNTNNTNTSNTNTNNTNTSNTNTDNTNTSNTNTDNTNTSNTNTDNTNTSNTNINNINTNSINTGNANKENTNLGGINTANHTSLNSIKSKLDNSISSNKLPYTGTNKIIILSAIVILISGIFTFIKYKRLKEIK